MREGKHFTQAGRRRSSGTMSTRAAPGGPPLAKIHAILFVRRIYWSSSSVIRIPYAMARTTELATVFAIVFSDIFSAVSRTFDITE